MGKYIEVKVYGQSYSLMLVLGTFMVYEDKANEREDGIGCQIQPLHPSDTFGTFTPDETYESLRGRIQEIMG